MIQCRAQKDSRMNELKIFENNEFGEIRTVTEGERTDYFVNGVMIDRFKLLAMACEAENEDEAWELMHIASILFHSQDDKTFNSLYGAVAMEITRSFIQNEFYYHGVFKKNYSKIRDGKVIKNKSDGKNIPDAWVERSGYIIPVEIKLNKFDENALQQLERYMKTYGSKKGIACARELSVKLPKNIEFISFSELEKADEK